MLRCRLVQACYNWGPAEPDGFRKQLLCPVMTEYSGASTSSLSDWSHWSQRGRGDQKTHTLSASWWRWLPAASQDRARMFSQTTATSEYRLLMAHSLPLCCPWLPLPPPWILSPGSEHPHLPDDPPVCHLPSFLTSILNLSTCPTPGVSSLAQDLPLIASKVEFPGTADGVLVNVSVKSTCKCRGIYFRSLISICRAAISWAPIGPCTQSPVQGTAERSSEFLGRPVLHHRAHNPELMWASAEQMEKHFEAAGFSWIKYLLISCLSLCPWRIQLKLNNKGGQACDLHKNTYPAIIGILGLTINARTVELGKSPKKSNKNDEGAER